MNKRDLRVGQRVDVVTPPNRWGGVIENKEPYNTALDHCVLIRFDTGSVQWMDVALLEEPTITQGPST